MLLARMPWNRVAPTTPSAATGPQCAASKSPTPVGEGQTSYTI